MSEVVEAEKLDPRVHCTEAGINRLRFQMMEYVQFLLIFARSQSTVLPVQVYERCVEWPPCHFMALAFVSLLCANLVVCQFHSRG